MGIRPYLSVMNHFGGNWTENKIDILVEYAGSYLTIMNTFATKYNWKLLYYDGFAGSGLIVNDLKDDNGQSLIFETESEVKQIIIGAAKRILEIDSPRAFDEYYFVEKNDDNFRNLQENTKEYSSKTIYHVKGDCNEKLLSMSEFLDTKKGGKYKVLAYIDPCGMQVEWNSIAALAGKSVDIWVLIPTGMGVNRLLTRKGEISKAWLNKLTSFLGLSEAEVLNFFYEYEEDSRLSLFGDKEAEKKVKKRENAIYRSGELYSNRLNEIFKYVSNPFLLRTQSKSVMYHFLMATNNKNAVNIANSIIKKYSLKNG